MVSRPLSWKVLIMSNNIKKVIYHSDDMGATGDITSRLIEAWERGLLDGFSIFADSSYLGNIKKSLLAAPGRDARIAVHLNLWEGKPLLQISKVSRLVDEDGYFNVGFLGILKNYLTSPEEEKKALLNEVDEEWDAQIAKVIETVKPRTVTALDGHIHIHMIPFLFKIATRLAKKYDIPEIRIVAEPYHFSGKFSDYFSLLFLKNTIKHLVLSACVPFDIRIAREAKIGHPEAMLGILYSGIMSRANITSGILAAKRKHVESIEVLMHIGRASEKELDRWKGDKKRASFVLSSRRDDEYKELSILRKEYNA
mgnify:CR=1 FL=1